MTDNDSAGTAAELDALYWQGHRYYRAHEADRALASLRKQLDEALMQASGDKIILARALDQAGADAEHDEKVIEALRADNAKKDAALREIEYLDRPQVRGLPRRKSIQQIALDALTPASQEAPASPAAVRHYDDATGLFETQLQEAPASPKDVHTAHTLAASPSPGLDDLPRDDTGRITSDYEPSALEIEVARRAIKREFGDSGTDGCYIRILKAIHAASPSPGLRDAVIEECAKVADECERSQDIDLGCANSGGAKAAAAAIRALFRPVSEREDKWCACLKRTVINCDCPERQEPQP